MFRKVVVGIDEETRGRDAIALARRLAAPNAVITFAHVHPAMTAAAMTAAAATAGRELGAQGEAPEATHDLLVAAIRESGVDAWMRWIGSPSVGIGLKVIAAELDADLLVVGSTARSRLTRTILGNPTTDSVAEADCAVAVAPLDYADEPHVLRRVGVAYDESAPSEAALELARQLAEDLGAELSAFEVVPAPRGVLEPRRHQVEKAVVALSQARDRISEHDGVEAHVACGNPVQQLAGYSRTVDLLVAGSRGAGPVALLLHPSTTAALTDVARCPLLIVTKGAREREPVAAG
jgi:nucleotide-binding universal stress UspA family protein